RIIRLAYSEHPSYVPLLVRAYELWHELEELDGRKLLYTTGNLEGGLPDGDVFRGAVEAATLHHIPHEVLSGAEVAARWPVYYLQAEEGRYYGFPEWGIPGFKFGRFHHLGETVDPDRMDREPNQRDEEVLRAFARRYFPDGCGPTVALKACLFTNTPDEHF